MVMDLNKCIGCQLCSMACKNTWTKKEGREYMWWNTVNTMPGKGTPKDFEKMGGGYKVLFEGRVREPILGQLPTRKEFGDLWKFNHEEIVKTKWGEVVLRAKNSDGTTPEWSMNWDEDQGATGISYPNSYFFYLPRICNHCTYPPCIDACPRHAIYKREEDGVVLIDQDRCKGYRFCLEACPYKKIYFNFETLTSQKCIFCYPRIEKGVTTACSRQCTGRVRFVDYLDNEQGPIYKLVKKWKVALPLFPQFGTEPNVFYVPPLAPPRLDDSGKIDPSKSRIPLKYLVYLFGPEVEQSLKVLQQEMQRTRDGEKSELMEILIAKRWNEMFGPFTKDPIVTA
ncbi:MAG: respiratory nitrate reductase subunit beta [Candidatus Abyssobacteria bacterium SURF_17]|uniref:Respiratory nitrate reductase subunit beta n=1 Tax=Candidatus Abyssobacteria bacterium SURF_17 TaxID=2093361 RepID=A0A419F7A5_9BACT|nr:MAG: respiratory nitrate reductase subunit beta [Candidatus Abyssubacteria bacterium SURF_17]